jgi:hypothetical protein
MRNVEYFLIGLLVDIPSLLTALVCIIIAAVRWKRHPKISLLVILSLLWLSLQLLIFEVVFFFLPQWLIDQGKSSSLDTFYMVTSLCNNILSALALSLLLIAIFVQRQPTPGAVQNGFAANQN